MRSFRPDWTRATGNQIALAFECASAAEVDEVYGRVVDGRLPRREGAVGRVLGPALRAARRIRTASASTSTPRSDRGDARARRAAASRSLRPPSADELIDEAAFDEDEFLPYWAELWPSGVALADARRRARPARAACARARRRARPAVARGCARRRRRARDRLGRRRRRAAARERGAERHRAARGARALGRAGAAAARGAVGPRPRRRPPLRAAGTPSSCSSSCRELGGEILLAEPGRPFATPRSSRTGTSRRWPTGCTACGYRDRVVALALALALLAPPKPHIVWKPIPFGAGARRGDRRVREAALRHRDSYVLQPRAIVEHVTATSTLLVGVQHVRRRRPRRRAARAARHVRALHRRPRRDDLPARPARPSSAGTRSG